ncbi:hypothetical protein [Chlorogloea sp. CCALA 695]|uniref:hypothetical protein n=1 Tax=Chlorogloea sp. CCALA 695 TaxID=2107693 RepID=UPI000D072DC5|nr:hypothetical protein [Chlorogloea sp. CCALA 695]PSB25846.1 hypothetical protein C7B70_24545 [Chlorogloea sp. CCALA 695]
MNPRHVQKAIFPFEGILQESYCKIAIYTVSENKNVVIIEELDANQGTSAINKIEEVITGITDKYNLDPATTIWISHCPEGQEGLFSEMEDFHRILIEWNGKVYEMKNEEQAWELLSRPEVENMIGTTYS